MRIQVCSPSCVAEGFSREKVEEFMAKKERKKVATAALPTKVMIIARFLVAMYVLYSAYQIRESAFKGDVLMICFMALFIVVGVALVIIAIRGFVLGYYQGGPMDEAYVDPFAKQAQNLEEIEGTAITEVASEAVLGGEEAEKTEADAKAVQENEVV